MDCAVDDCMPFLFVRGRGRSIRAKRRCRAALCGADFCVTRWQRRSGCTCSGGAPGWSSCTGSGGAQGRSSCTRSRRVGIERLYVLGRRSGMEWPLERCAGCEVCCWCGCGCGCSCGRGCGTGHGNRSHQSKLCLIVVVLRPTLLTARPCLPYPMPTSKQRKLRAWHAGGTALGASFALRPCCERQ